MDCDRLMVMTMMLLYLYCLLKANLYLAAGDGVLLLGFFFIITNSKIPLLSLMESIMIFDVFSTLLTLLIRIFVEQNMFRIQERLL